MPCMSSALTDLCRYPIVQAPMAGGASCPQLAAAVSEAGGLGFLAAGYKTADGMYQEIKQLRGLTGAALRRQPLHAAAGTADPAAVEVYRQQLAGEAAWYETPLGDPDSGRRRRLRGQARDPPRRPGSRRLLHLRLPDPRRARRLRQGRHVHRRHRHHARGGAGRAVGGRRRRLRPGRRGRRPPGHPPRRPRRPTAPGIGLLSLIALVRETVQLPIIAAGGLMRGGQIAARARGGRGRRRSSAPRSWSAPSPAPTRCTSRP